MPPLLTVALCTHNHADRLRRTLSDLSRLKPPQSNREFLVIDNGSTDETATLLATPGWEPNGFEVRVVREERLGVAHARNRAVKEAGGEYIIFLDDDETPDPEWLIAYENDILEHRPDAFGGRIEVEFEDGKRPPWLKDELLGFLGKLDHGEARWLTEPGTPIFGGNCGFRRTVFDRIGDFDARLGRKGANNDGGEDTDIYCRLIEHGCSVHWVPAAVINHRIQTPKLRRTYFLDLHYRQGRMEGARKRGGDSRVPPLYLIGQVLRAYRRAIGLRLREGATNSLRLEMNAAYFSGYLEGWLRDRT